MNWFKHLRDAFLWTPTLSHGCYGTVFFLWFMRKSESDIFKLIDFHLMKYGIVQKEILYQLIEVTTRDVHCQILFS